uniref:vesicle-fusing ATPase-like n=1 Tax=Jaculus jaculus TaxID=51337 RepID=UPI001E1B26F2|nr:vesicle-fusing ATPase-like [Jaculus jaculus]
MVGRSMQAARCPTDELSVTNCAVVNEEDFQSGQHVVWAGLSIEQEIELSLYTFDKAKQCVGMMTLEIDFLQKKNLDSNLYDTDKMAAEFIQQFNNQAFLVGQQLVFSYNDKLFGLLVKDIEAIDPSILKGEPAAGKRQKIEVGLVIGNSQVAFEKAEISSLNLIEQMDMKNRTFSAERNVNEYGSWAQSLQPLSLQLLEITTIDDGLVAQHWAIGNVLCVQCLGLMMKSSGLHWYWIYINPLSISHNTA